MTAPAAAVVPIPAAPSVPVSAVPTAPVPSVPVIRGGNSCSRVGFVSCQVMSIRLHRSTLTRHVY